MATQSQPLVIGGGVGGLTAAYELTRLGYQPIVLEAFRWAGGVVGHHEVGGIKLDAGADSYAIATDSVLALLADLGMADQVQTPNPVGAWIRHDGGSAPLPVGGVLGIPANPLASDVVAIVGQEAAQRAMRDGELPADAGLNPDGVTTLGALVRYRMGDAIVERLVEPIVGGVHSADPDGLDIDVITPRLRAALAKHGNLMGAVGELRGGAGKAGSAVAGLRGGMHTMIVALQAAIEAAGGQVRANLSAQSLTPEGDQWQVACSDGSTLSAPAVILAVPGKAMAPLLAGLAPELAAELDATKSCESLLVTLVVDNPALDAAPRGTGILVSAKASGVVAKAMTCATIKWPELAERAGAGRHVLRLSYGRDGAGIPEREHTMNQSLADASELLGLPIEPDQLVDTATVRWRQAMPKADALHAGRVLATRQFLASHVGLTAVGAFMAGTGLASVVADARVRAGEIAKELADRSA